MSLFSIMMIMREIFKKFIIPIQNKFGAYSPICMKLLEKSAKLFLQNLSEDERTDRQTGGGIDSARRADQEYI